jgi:AraC family transcriptional regulator of adaptative response/methylated-DNA-[protein]-cysteine methyltransferase
VVVPVHLTPIRENQAGEKFQVTWSRIHTTIGDAFVAETARGVCYLSFNVQAEENKAGILQLLPNAQLTEGVCKWEKTIPELIGGSVTPGTLVPVHVRCTDFQFRVWTELLSTGFGKMTTYGDLALALGDGNASRAVGSALAANPVAWLIPCHRVVNADGSCGNFRWGPARKKLFLSWEASRTVRLS